MTARRKGMAWIKEIAETVDYFVYWAWMVIHDHNSTNLPKRWRKYSPSWKGWRD